MPIDLSSSPPKCNHCILGKQAHSSVLKVWEGVKATTQLERVYMNLTGPISLALRSGFLNAMNIIDDFSSYVWTIALKTKVDASKAFQIWCNIVENQLNEHLKILITDNRELLSNNMLKWCGDHGIEHLLTAPYTSAQNGCTEHLHLHCTITKSAKSS